MSETRARCPECGAILPEGLPTTRCPCCLIGLGLLTDGPASDEVSASPPGPSPPVAGAGAADRLPPLRFGDYELREEIARGGMGVVHKARQLSLGRWVAVKRILAGEDASPQFVQRFLTEAAAAAELDHPNIVSIHEVGVHEGQHYFSMDLVDGPSLAALVGNTPLAAKRAARYVRIVAEAVQYAHSKGILHRDLKPSNVLIDSTDQPRVTDFGLAKRLEGETSLTLSGQMAGSPSFMPPEQASAGQGRVGRYSDVYALGGILYHLLTARPPFQADSVGAIVFQVLTAEPVSPRLLNPTVPRDLETICLKCLEKEPARRYGTAQEVADELGRFLAGSPIQARPVGGLGRAWKWCSRRPAQAALGGALALTLVLGLAGVLWQWHRASIGWSVARQSAYAGDIRLAQLALQSDNRVLAIDLLSKHRPVGKGETDLRGWEWRYLWRRCQPDMAFSLRPGFPGGGAVALSQDGRLLAAQTGGSRMTLWEVTTKRIVAELPGLEGIRAIGLSPDGGLLAVSRATQDLPARVELWDLKSQKLTHSWSPTSPAKALAVSPDGRLLAMLSEQGIADVLEWPSNRTLTQLTAAPLRRGGTGVVVFSPEGNRLAVGADYGWLRVLHVKSGDVRTIETGTLDGVSALAFSAGSDLLAAGFAYSSGTVGLWDPDTGELRGQLTNATPWTRALAFSPNGRHLAVAGVNGTIRLWDVAARTEWRRLLGHAAEGVALAFEPDGQALVSGCGQGAACLWDLTPNPHGSTHATLAISFEMTPNAPARSFTRGALDPRVVQRLGLVFTPDSRRFITTEPEGTPGRWDARTLQQTERLPELGTNCWQVALSPDARWLAVGDAAGKVHVWDWLVRRRVASLALPFEWAGHLGFSPSGRFLLATSTFNNRTVAARIWKVDRWEEVSVAAIRAAGVLCMDLSPDDRCLAVGYVNGAVRLWAFPTGRLLAGFTNHHSAVWTVRFSPEGLRLASTSTDSKVRIWEVQARRELAILPGHSGWVWGAAFSSDGRRLATGGNTPGDAVKLWDLATHRELLTLPGEGSIFVRVGFSPDGNVLAATGLSGVANFWRAPSWEEIEGAEKVEAQGR